MNRHKIKLIPYFSSLLLLCGASCIANEPERLQGESSYYYGRIFKVMEASLYLQDPAHAESILAAVPKKIEFCYFKNIGKDRFVDRAEKALAKNIQSDQLQKIRAQVQQMHEWYEDVKKGDVYAFSYLPGTGTQLAVNGIVKGRIPGDAFAAAYFSIWLGEHPVNKTLRDDLLNLAGKEKAAVE